MRYELSNFIAEIRDYEEALGVLDQAKRVEVATKLIGVKIESTSTQTQKNYTKSIQKEELPSSQQAQEIVSENEDELVFVQD